MDPVSENFSLNLEKKGKILQLCFAVEFFYNMSEERERLKGILDVLDEHTDMVGNAYRWTQNPNTYKWKKLKHGVDSYVHPREWVLDTTAYRWNIIYHGGEKSSDASDVEFDVYHRGNTPNDGGSSFTRIHLPLTVLCDPQGLVERIRRWCDLIRPDHGHAGFSLVQSHGYEASGSECEYNMAQRFPGVDKYYTVSNALQLGYWIKCADWLTILSDAFLEKIGGLGNVRQRMGNLPVLEYAGGAILQAGAMPQLGDVEQNIPMTDYRHVAAIVEPLRHKEFKSSSTMSDVPIFNAKTYRAWLARFSPEQK